MEMVELAHHLMSEAKIYDQNDLFDIIHPISRKHYATVRKAIAHAKETI